MVRSLTLAWLAVALLWSSPASAWHAQGHMMVAEAAWQRLSPQARKRAKALMKLNPSYSTWVAGVPAAQRAERAFVMASIWPDAIKKAGSGYTMDGNKPTGPESAFNKGYTDKRQHRYWHFIDEPFSTDGSPTEPFPSVNAEERIKLFTQTIASPSATKRLKSYDLVWLIHLVGDVHQPLHATTRFIAGEPDGDRGGNNVKLTCCGGDLHTFWDAAPGDNNDPLVAIQAAASLPIPAQQLAIINDPDVWVHESFELAKSDVYKSPPIGATDGPFDISVGTYQADAQRLALDRVALAAARLANLIEENLR
jgi:hypothetical protein